MNTDKEIAAFVDRMAKRVNDAKGSRRGRHRAAFIAARPLVEAALGGGHTLKATWEALREEGKLSMTYETFRGYCRTMRTEKGASARSAGDLQMHQPKPAGSSLGSAAPTAPEQERARPASPLPALSAAAGDSPSFRHERVPRTGKIYG